MAINRTAAQVAIAVSHGDERVFVLRRRTSRTGPVIDMTGMDATLALLDRASGAVLCTLSTTAGGIEALDATGEVRIDQQHAAYAAMAPGQYALRLDLVESGRTRPWLRGTWSIV
jgi:hypothetical protein